MKCLYIAFLIFVPLAQAGPPSHVVRLDLKPELRAYSVAAGLPALTSKSGFELRIWSLDYMGGAVGGTVISNGSLRSFNSTSQYKNEKVIIAPAPLSASSPLPDASKLKELVAELEPYSGQSVSCGVMDGGSVDIQAVIQGRMIMISADNPDFCSDKTSKIVVRILQQIDSQTSHPAAPNSSSKRTREKPRAA